MRSLAFTGVALGAMMVSQPVFAEIDSGVGAPPVAAPAPPKTENRMPEPPVAPPQK